MDFYTVEAYAGQFSKVMDALFSALTASVLLPCQCYPND